QSDRIARLIPPARGDFQTSAGTTGNAVQGNYIGTNANGNNANGTSGLGNTLAGVIIESGASNNRVGGAGPRNVVADNGTSGIVVQDPTTTGNVIQGNLLGTDATGTQKLGNAISGVYLWKGTHDNLIGTDGDGVNDPAERNVISANLNDGVTIDRANNNV